MLELGYAMQSIGSSRIVSVMNEAFGKAKDGLPFDLAHRRWPIRYILSTDTSPEIRKKVREELVSDLVSAIRNIVENEEDISLQAYKRQALSELTSLPHTHWKNAYMALYPGNFINTGYSGGDVWDLFINVPQHEYSEAEWKKYLPLFHQIIDQMCDRLERLMILHSSVLPTSVKVAITSATGNLRMQRALYMAMPKINNEHGGGGDLLGFDMRFKDVSKTLSAFIRTVDSARKSL
jgi:hypothetical protein